MGGGRCGIPSSSAKNRRISHRRLSKHSTRCVRVCEVLCVCVCVSVSVCVCQVVNGMNEGAAAYAIGLAACGLVR